MTGKDTKQPTGTLKAAMEAVSREVDSSPRWLKSIYERNDVLDQHRRHHQQSKDKS